MSKKNKSIVSNTINMKGNKSLIQLHTSYINKKGKLKGDNKNHTKLLHDTYMFHKINKKGKVKPTTEVASDGYVYDTVTKKSFRAKPYSKEERKDICGNMRNFTDHTKFLAVALDADENTLRRLAEFSVGLRDVEKINKRCTKIVTKDDGIKKKKKDKFAGKSHGSWKLR